MNACARHESKLTLLAVDALTEAEAAGIRLHLETCPDCRQRLGELRQLSRDLGKPIAMLPTLEAPAGFHQALMQKIRTQPGAPFPAALGCLLDWWRTPRLAWGVLAGLAVLVLLLVIPDWKTAPVAPNPPQPGAPIQTVLHRDQPTSRALATYQRALRDSPEALDELVRRQVLHDDATAAGMKLFALREGTF